MDFSVALDQLLVSVEPVEREVGFDQAVESHFTRNAAAYRIEGFLAEHSAQVFAEVAKVQVLVKRDFQNGVHRLVEQCAFGRVVVVLQEIADQLEGCVELAEREVDEQFEFENGELAPDRVLVELDADQGFDVGVVVELAFFQAFHQAAQRRVIEAMQAEDIFAVIQSLVGVVPDQVFERVHLGVAGDKDATGDTEVGKFGHVGFFPQRLQDTEQTLALFGVAAREIPFAESEVVPGAEEAPQDYAGRVDVVSSAGG